METTYLNTNELNPQEIFQTMKSDFYQISNTETPLINKEYIKKRKDIINFNHRLTKKMGFKSQTFFLSIYYLDIIFMENQNLQITNFLLFGLSSFIIAAKYSENDPNVPPLQSFINLYNRYNIHRISMKELLKTEVKILKYLKYNIHYVTIYDFNLFFFNHGIIKKQQIKDIINNNTNCNINNRNTSNKNNLSANEELDFIFDDSFYIKKILEKIYKKSRYYLDLIISNENICFKYDSLLISICIMKKSVEDIILKEYKLKFKDYFLNKRQIIKKNNNYFKEIMTNFYKVDFESDEKYNEIIKDNDIMNIFQRQEKQKQKFDINNKKNKLKENLFSKISNINVNNKYKENNNFCTINTETIKNNTNYISNIKNKSVINMNNSIEKRKEKSGIKSNKTLLNNFKQKNNIRIEEENNEMYSNNSYIENIRNKYTFNQLKNNIKKDLSLRKKRCNDKYFHINNLKSLCKLASCANTIQNIKEGSLSKGKIENENKNGNSSQKVLLTENTNISNNVNILNTDEVNNQNLYYKKGELKLENIDNNKIKYNKVIIANNFHSKEKNQLKFKKTITETNNLNSNPKPYFRKVIQNYEPINKKIINKNNIKINIYNILNTSNNINEIKEIENKSNFISLTNENNYSQQKKNKIDLLNKRMNEINKLKNIYDFKKLDLNIRDNLNNNNSTEIKRDKRLKIFPKSNSKSKEINYINIINDTNDDTNNIDILSNKVSTLDNPSSYFRKKIFNSLNDNKKNLKNNKFNLKKDNINSERQGGIFNNQILLTSVKIKDNNENNINNNELRINEFFRKKYNLQFHPKVLNTLTHNNNIK